MFPHVSVAAEEAREDDRFVDRDLWDRDPLPTLLSPPAAELSNISNNSTSSDLNCPVAPPKISPVKYTSIEVTTLYVIML